MDEILDEVKKLTIKDTKYYESNTATASDAQGNLTQSKETFTHTSNRIFEQKLLSNWTIPILPSPANREIDQGIETIRLAPQMLLTLLTKEIVAGAVSGSAWISRNLWQVSRTSVNGSTPGDISNDIGIIEPYSTVMIGIIGTDPPCGLNISQEVGDKRQPTSPGLVRKSQKLDAVADGNLSDDWDLTSISER